MRKLTLLLLVLGLMGNLMAQFSLPQLPYAYNALEPVIDAQTMEIHHSKHHAAYVNNLNNAVKGTPAAEMSIDDINKNISKYSMAVRNNGGGHFNHSLFWSVLTAEKNTMPNAGLKKAIGDFVLIQDADDEYDIDDYDALVEKLSYWYE
jgi:Fe-Mn family superoxide dismutase